MDILLHDVKNIEQFCKINSDELMVIADNGKIKPCLCCYGCWIKTPGKCMIDDGYNNMAMFLSECSRLIIVSQCFYGCYSPFVKNVIDRSIPYLLPYFRIKHGETHHAKRYKNNVVLEVHFYGEMSEMEKETARKLVKANEINMFTNNEVHFYKSIEEIQEISR
jgi:multimeric flavodoxin WrbA